LIVKDRCSIHPYNQETIGEWRAIALGQWEIYKQFWDQKGIDYGQLVHAEQDFSVTYSPPHPNTLPFRLRGRWDGVRFQNGRVILWETKTKGDIDELSLENQLTNDLQTMMYIVALQEARNQGLYDIPSGPFQLVYNVIRRPRSGGRHTIRQRKSEGLIDFHQRLMGLIESDPEYFFMRWERSITTRDIDQFKARTLDPILRQLDQWYNWVTIPDKGGPFIKKDPWTNSQIHFRHPYGVFNPVHENFAIPVDALLNSGDSTKLTKTTNLFPELD